MVRLTRRLSDEFETVRSFLAAHPHIDLVAAAGQPVDRYTVSYKLQGLAPALDGHSAPEERSNHLVLFFLFPGFPLQAPSCRFLTPVFHPAVKGEVINLADVWDPNWELTDLILYVGRVIAYQEVLARPVLNQEAVNWMLAHPYRVPLDHADLRRALDVPFPDNSRVDPQAPDLEALKRQHSQISPAMEEVLADPRYPQPIWRENSEMILGPADESPVEEPLVPAAAPHKFAIVGTHARLTEVATGVCHVLPEAELTIGRGAHNQIVIPDSSVSRTHCRLEYSVSGYSLVDMSSTNGTFLNETAVATATMRAGDKLRLGGALMIFEQD